MRCPRCSSRRRCAPSCSSRCTRDGPRKLAPTTLIQILSAASGVLFLGEWVVRFQAPAATATLLFLHTSAMGPLLTSGFWLIATERFEPRTAKRRFGQITGAGTVGGLLGALVAERVAATLGAPAMLLVLGALQLLTVWLFSRFAARTPASRRTPTPSTPAPHGLEGAIRSPGHCRGAASAASRGAGPARLHERRVARLSVQGEGGRSDWNRRPAPSLLRPLLCGNQPPDVHSSGGLEPCRARAIWAGADDEHAFHRAAGRQHRRAGGARLRQPCDGAGGGVDLPRVMVSRRLRALLHADSGRREARRQVDRRRERRSPRRRRWRRRSFGWPCCSAPPCSRRRSCGWPLRARPRRSSPRAA